MSSTWIVLGFGAMALFAYALTGGADFGVGIMECFAAKADRADIRIRGERAIAPIWEANHIWLILALVVAFVGFPGVHVYATTFLHIPILIMLIGIILRGTAFTFRYYNVQDDPSSQLLWTLMFRSGSLIVPFFFGILAATTSSGRLPHEASGVWASYVSPWLALFPLATGVFISALFAWLAAVFLLGEIEEGQRPTWIRRAKRWTLAVVVSGGLVSFSAGIDGVPWFRELPSNPIGIGAVSLATVLIGLLWRGLSSRGPWTLRCLAASILACILMGYWGSHFPAAILRAGTTPLNWFEEAAPAATMDALASVLIGASIIILPALGWLYHVFKTPYLGIFILMLSFGLSCQSVPINQDVPSRPPPIIKNGLQASPSFLTSTNNPSHADNCTRTSTSIHLQFAVQEDLNLVRKPNLVGLPFALSKKHDVRSLNGFYASSIDGQILPAQFETLSRWNSGPKDCSAPIRWAYAWIRADLRPDSRGYFLVKHQPQASPSAGTSIVLHEDKDKIIINTGVARFEIKKKRFNGLSKVELKDGEQWALIAKTPADAKHGMLVARANQYASPFRAKSTNIEIERRGPQLVSIAIKTHYLKPNQKPYFGLTMRLQFLAGEASVLIDHTYYHGQVMSEAPDGARNRILSDRVFFQLPLAFKPKEVIVRANQTSHSLKPDADISVVQQKRSPTQQGFIYAISQENKDIEIGHFALQPFLSVKNDTHWVLASIAYLSARDPQGLRFNAKENALEIDWQSEELFVGGARGIWSRAVIEFGKNTEKNTEKNTDKDPGGFDLRGQQAYAYASRPLIAAQQVASLNRARAWPRLPVHAPKGVFGIVDDKIDGFHETTVDYLRRYRISGTQIWPDLPRSSCIFEADCAFALSHYFDGGDNNYWDWSLPELEAFLRTADPAFLHDFALPLAYTMAETISWRPAARIQSKLTFSGFSPCYGSAQGYEGPWMEGLNQRRDRCPGDYSYNRVHQLAYILTADRRFTDFFSQGASSVAQYYTLPVDKRPGVWRELSSSRFTNQFLEQLLNGMEFGRIGGLKQNQRFRNHAIALFDFMRVNSLPNGHACILAGTGYSDVKRAKLCESDQAWMLPLLLAFTTRLYSFTGHAPIRDWLQAHGETSMRHYMGVSLPDKPDFSLRESDWTTTYLCPVTTRGLIEPKCEKAPGVENNGRFYNGQYLTYLSTFGRLLWAMPDDPLGICGWLPDTYSKALRLLDREESNAMVWGKVPGMIFADAQSTLGAIETCD